MLIISLDPNFRFSRIWGKRRDDWSNRFASENLILFVFEIFTKTIHGSSMDFSGFLIVDGADINFHPFPSLYLILYRLPLRKRGFNLDIWIHTRMTFNHLRTGWSGVWFIFGARIPCVSEGLIAFYAPRVANVCLRVNYGLIVKLLVASAFYHFFPSFFSLLAPPFDNRHRLVFLLSF